MLLRSSGEFFPVPGRVNVVFPVEGFLALTFFLGFLMAQLGCKGLDPRCTTQRVSSCFVFLPANSAFNEYDMQFFICSRQYIDYSVIWVNCKRRLVSESGKNRLIPGWWNIYILQYSIITCQDRSLWEHQRTCILQWLGEIPSVLPSCSAQHFVIATWSWAQWHWGDIRYVYSKQIRFPELTWDDVESWALLRQRLKTANERFVRGRCAWSEIVNVTRSKRGRQGWAQVSLNDTWYYGDSCKFLQSLLLYMKQPVEQILISVGMVAIYGRLSFEAVKPLVLLNWLLRGCLCLTDLTEI